MPVISIFDPPQMHRRMSQAAKSVGSNIDKPTPLYVKKVMKDFLRTNAVGDTKVFFGRVSSSIMADRAIRRMKEGGIKVDKKSRNEVFENYSVLAKRFNKIRMPFYDPASHTLAMFGNNSAIGLHEAGHAVAYKGENPFGIWSKIEHIGRNIIPGGTALGEGLASYRAWKYIKEKNIKADTSKLTRGFISYLPKEALKLLIWGALAAPFVMKDKLAKEELFPLHYTYIKVGSQWQVAKIQE